MGYSISKPPARTVLLDGEAADLHTGLPTVTQPGYDSLGVPDTERNYPDVEPPAEPASEQHASNNPWKQTDHMRQGQQMQPNGHIRMLVSPQQLPKSQLVNVRERTTGRSVPLSHQGNTANNISRKPVTELEQMLLKWNNKRRRQNIGKREDKEEMPRPPPNEVIVAEATSRHEQVSPLDDVDYTMAETLAYKHVDHSAETYAALTRDLTATIVSDTGKVWAIIAWISRQRIGHLKFGPKPPRSTTPNGYMKLMQEGQGTYSAFFALLCRSSGLPCVIIQGTSKHVAHDVGVDVLDVRSSWNAVFVCGAWRLVHPLLACMSTPDHGECSWIGVNRDTGGRIAPPEVHTLDSYYIFTEPREYIYGNFPDDPRWQLMTERWTNAEFLSGPFLRPEFFKQGFKLLSSSALVSESGESLDIVIGFAARLYHRLVFTYQFELKRYRLNERIDENLTIIRSDTAVNKRAYGRFVVVRKYKDSIRFGIRFPNKGAFRLRVFAGSFTTYRTDQHWIADFRLVSRGNVLNPHPLPFDPGILGWGPGPMTDCLGLHVPSHTGSTVVVRDDEQTLIQFILVKRIRARANLHHRSVSCERLRRYIHYDVVEIRDTFELRVVVQSPGADEYGLEISVFSKQTQGYENACNYLLHTQPKRRHESYYVRKARHQLLVAILDCDVTMMEMAVARCKALRIPQDDPEILASENKQTFLQCRRALRNSLVKNRADLVRGALIKAREAGLDLVLSREIARADRHLHHLNTLEESGWNSQMPDIDRSSLLELSLIRNPKPEVRKVMTAILLLLGNRDIDLKSWSRVQRLLRHPEDTLLRMASLARLASVHPAGGSGTTPLLDAGTIATVQRILDTVPAAAVRRVDSAAASYHHWVSMVMDAIWQHTPQNTT